MKIPEKIEEKIQEKVARYKSFGCMECETIFAEGARYGYQLARKEVIKEICQGCHDYAFQENGEEEYNCAICRWNEEKTNED